jgi:geranylgeranyl pyrophosphate synthase
LQAAGKFQEWIDEFLLEENQDPAYRAAISTVLSTQLNQDLYCEGQPQPFSLFNLPCFVCSALGGDWQNAIEVNAAWYLLYAAFDLIDKVEDREINDILSCGLEENVLINVATGLILSAELILARVAGEEGFNSTNLKSLFLTFNRMALKVCAGQHLDLVLKDPDLSQVWQIAEAKSGDFFALACWLGAHAAISDPDRLESMRTFGRHLGILIQIANDIEGVWDGNGKISDLASGKVTLPVAYALNVLPSVERSILKQLIPAKTRDNEVKARQLILSKGGLIYMMLEAEKHRQQAKDILNGLPVTESQRENLLMILDRIGRIDENKGIQQVEG